MKIATLGTSLPFDVQFAGALNKEVGILDDVGFAATLRCGANACPQTRAQLQVENVTATPLELKLQATCATLTPAATTVQLAPRSVTRINAQQDMNPACLGVKPTLAAQVAGGAALIRFGPWDGDYAIEEVQPPSGYMWDLDGARNGPLYGANIALQGGPRP